MLTILQDPHPLLRTISEPVTEFNQELNDIILQMQNTLKSSKGVALAAIQVGIPQRIVVAELRSYDNRIPRVFINPEIMERSQECNASLEEGCLSIKEGARKIVPRASVIKVRAYNKEGHPFEITLKGLPAICLQHEIDHLNGVLYTDY